MSDIGEFGTAVDNDDMVPCRYCGSEMGGLKFRAQGQDSWEAICTQCLIKTWDLALGAPNVPKS